MMGNAVGATRAGDTFFRGFDVGSDGQFPDMSFPATVSDFRLDTYAVSVGRFRAFVSAGKGTQSDPPPDGSGAHAKIANSGWSASDNINLTANVAAFEAAPAANTPPDELALLALASYVPLHRLAAADRLLAADWRAARAVVQQQIAQPREELLRDVNVVKGGLEVGAPGGLALDGLGLDGVDVIGQRDGG